MPSKDPGRLIERLQRPLPVCDGFMPGTECLRRTGNFCRGIAFADFPAERASWGAAPARNQAKWKRLIHACLHACIQGLHCTTGTRREEGMSMALDFKLLHYQPAAPVRSFAERPARYWDIPNFRSNRGAKKRSGSRRFSADDLHAIHFGSLASWAVSRFTVAMRIACNPRKAHSMGFSRVADWPRPRFWPQIFRWPYWGNCPSYARRLARAVPPARLRHGQAASPRPAGAASR